MVENSDHVETALANGEPIAFDSTVPAAQRVLGMRAVLASIEKNDRLRLKNAVISGCLDLSNRKIGGTFSLIDCRVAGFRAENSVFENTVELKRSIFSGDVTFLGASCDRTLILEESVFYKDLSLWNVHVDSGLSAPDIRVFGTFTMTEAKIDASANLDGSIFQGSAEFDSARVGQSLNFYGSRFYGGVSFEDTCASAMYGREAIFAVAEGGDEFVAAAFNNSVISSNLDLSGSWFRGEAQFIGVDVGDELDLDRVTLLSAVDLDKCRCSDLLVRGATGRAEICLRDATVRSMFNACEARFHKGLDLTGSAIADFLADATDFVGGLKFAFGKVSTRLRSDGAIFGDDFVANGLRVDGEFRLRETIFERDVKLTSVTVIGTVDFSKATVMGRFEMTGGRFEGDVICDILTVTELDMSGARLKGSLSLSGGGTAAALALRDVKIEGSLRLALRVTSGVDLDGIDVEGYLRLEGLTVGERFEARYLKVGRDITSDGTTRLGPSIRLSGARVAGAARFSKLAFEVLDLRRASFGALELDDGSRLDRYVGASVDLTDCDYSLIVATPNLLLGAIGAPEPLATFRHLCKASLRPTKSQRALPSPSAVLLAFWNIVWLPGAERSDRQPYLTYERVLRKRGRDSEADEIYYEGQRQSSRGERSPTRVVSNGVSWFVTGYGVRGVRLIRALLFVIACSTLFFLTTRGATHHLAVGAVLPAATATAASLDVQRHSCDWSELPGLGTAVTLVIRELIPVATVEGDWAITPSCRLQFSWQDRPLAPPWPTFVTIVILKSCGLILIPIGLGILSGILRPSPRA